MHGSYKKKIAIFVYARSDSSRLPNKVFKKFFNKYLIDIIFDKVKQIHGAEPILLTTDRDIDDRLADHVFHRGSPVFRGDSFDLVKRTTDAITEFAIDKFIRVNADSPFFDPSLISFGLRFSNQYELVTNLINRTFPYGVALEIVDSELYINLKDYCNPNDAEHVTKHLYANQQEINFLNITQSRDDSNIRVAIDSPEDIERLEKEMNKIANQYYIYEDLFGLEKLTPNIPS